MPEDAYQSTPGTEQLAALLGSLSLIILIISLASIVITIIIWWTIFSKAGYSGALSLLFLIPIANVVMLLVFAFGKWPILRELEMLRQQQGAWPYQQVQQRPSNPQYPPYQQGQQYPSSPPYP
jgi:uncharacterized membrane protein YhaH (DUF805 family)